MNFIGKCPITVGTMKLTKERKILMGALGAGLFALGVDRVMLGTDSDGPRSAEASEGTGQVATAAPAVPPAPIFQAGSNRRDVANFSEVLPLSERLNRLNVAANNRDLFAITDRWITAPVVVDDGGLLGRAAARRFVETHRLQAIALRHGDQAATVDGRVVRVGETLDGFTLESLAPGSATFKGADNTRARLTMQGH